MLAPEQDLADRRPIWDELQMFWMDTHPALFLKRAAQVCARSKYTLSEIERIYWNEVRPALWLNAWAVAGEWKGFEIGGLSERILKTNRFGRRLPIRLLHPSANDCWEKLCAEIERERVDSSAQ